ncbi:ABC transporter permease [Saccharibacillus sp. CPCC 101409]|uniref:ABC transporter permease n=1 Tax=Saccharibacillus sp. CPCC 101409 TaxID=3058041 RepID=UPI0026732FA8|nr:ABC transporter permease [Saccharibacillus sp. CPCC 101409]MDO3408251.1 ABC transporter permease [Saccharibacillus sp. CPCC 101409]
MGAYLLKRIGALIPTLLIMSVIVFLIVYLIPGDPARVMLGEGADEDSVRQLRQQMGLNEPLLRQYVDWALSALRGDMGDSYVLRKPVTQAILEYMRPTLSLAVAAEVFALAIALPLGLQAASRRGGWADRLLSAYSLLGMTVPGFLLSLFLVLLFSVKLHWLPVSGYAPLSTGLGNFLKYLILPAVSVGVLMSALIARMVRASVLEVRNQDYVRTARAKGVRETRILYRHMLRNALIPILTVVGGTFGTLVAGAAIVETIFNIPGMGQLLVSSVSHRDYAVVQGIVLVIAGMYVLVNLAVDLLYAAVDPRVKIRG